MRFSELEGRQIGVWGAGAETRSFAHQLSDKLSTARVTVVVLEEPVDAPELTAEARVVEAAEAVEALRACDVLVRSPGVSIHRPELRELARQGLEITTPTGLWFHEREGRNVLGVTGTKGKSTTASLTAHLARASGAQVQLAGNIGPPALDLLDEPTDDLAIVELSSYQIADLPVGPETAMVLNIYPEHLDWHLAYETYEREKLRLLSLPGVRACVVNATEARVTQAPTALGARIHRFGLADGWHVTGGGISYADALAVTAADIPQSLPGPHNALNLCAGLTALDAVGIALPPLPQALDGFVGLPHRLQTICDRDGVVWVDDSISTTPESAIAAVESFPDRQIILIGGGFDRGQDHAQLGSLLAARGAIVIGLPTTGTRLVADARAAGIAADRAFTVGDLPAATAAAEELAAPGSAVLLTPAAPSYNSYKNHIERGEHFARLVNRTDS